MSQRCLIFRGFIVQTCKQFPTVYSGYTQRCTRAHLYDGTEPACVADVLQADGVVAESLSLMGVERIHRDASQRETDLLHGALSLRQTGLQSPDRGRGEPCTMVQPTTNTYSRIELAQANSRPLNVRTILPRTAGCEIWRPMIIILPQIFGRFNFL